MSEEFSPSGEVPADAEAVQTVPAEAPLTAEVPASEDPSKKDLTQELGDPIKVTFEGSESEQVPVATAEVAPSDDPDKIDLTQELSSEASSTESGEDATKWTPEQEGQPVGSTPEVSQSPEASEVATDSDNETQEQASEDSHLESIIAAALKADTMLVKSIEENKFLAQKDKDTMIATLKAKIANKEKGIRDSYEKYEQSFQNVLETATRELPAAISSGFNSLIINITFNHDSDPEVGIFGTSVVETQDRPHCSRLVSSLMSVLGAENPGDSILPQCDTALEDIIAEHKVTIDGKQAMIRESYDHGSKKYIFGISFDEVAKDITPPSETSPEVVQV